ncbi:hypothetical protein CCANI_00330 [Corynebacterium canis]|nr:hypothetical protein CCANI_00330 [Corynebacterium canis]
MKPPPPAQSVPQHLPQVLRHASFPYQGVFLNLRLLFDFGLAGLDGFK